MSAPPPVQDACSWLTQWARLQPAKTAFFMVGEDGAQVGALTYGQLDRAARRIAATMQGARGERALLVYSSGLDFVLAFFGCLYAGVVPVPVVPPRRGKVRSATFVIAENCQPRYGFAPADTLPALEAGLPAEAVRWTTVEDCLARTEEAEPARPQPTDLAFLQYTSGSTSAPKGVMVSHANLQTNLEMLRRSTAASTDSVYACWLPLFHDMGLVWNVLEPVYLGAQAVLMTPMAFIHRPLTWLKAISDYGASIGGAPNFAYESLVARYSEREAAELDLSSWRFAYNAAEPVRAETIAAFVKAYEPHGFSAAAMHPGYGMAESTLMISLGPPGRATFVRSASKAALLQNRFEPGAGRDATTLVACGAGPAEQRLAIVDPASRRELAPGQVGEIWVAGPHIAQGYYRNPEATEHTFRARLGDTGEGPFLRTGDLGLVLEGEVYITGRHKDVLIIRGQNHYPQDIEHTAERSHPALRRHFSAAFLVDDGSQEKLVVVAEVDKGSAEPASTDEVAQAVRAAVVAEHDLLVSELVLIRHGTLAKTSSGKVQRAFMREAYRSGGLEPWTPRAGTP